MRDPKVRLIIFLFLFMIAYDRGLGQSAQAISQALPGSW
jgi:hypothetical protein